MKTIPVLFALIGAIIHAQAWDGNFNRLSRNLVPTFSYGNEILAGSNQLPSVGGYQPNMQNEVYGIVESVMDVDPCYGRKCSSNENCCPGSVCVTVDADIGTCLFMYGRKIGDLCHRNADCETGLTCEKGPTGSMVCQAPMAARQFGEDCNTSSECDITRGLCCQLQRRHHRRVPKKVCSYFKDPLICIDVIPIREDTSMEKGLSPALKHALN